MEPHYRKAEMIELHDAGVVVHVEDSEGAVWREAPTLRGTYLSVNGDGLAHLLEAMGVAFDADMLFGSSYDVLFRRPPRAGARRSGRPVVNVPGITELRVRPEGDRLLHIFVTFRPGDTEGDEEEEAFVQEITYSGSYTVWWAAAEE